MYINMPTQSVVVLLCRRNFFLQSLPPSSLPSRSSLSTFAVQTRLGILHHCIAWLGCQPSCGAGCRPESSQPDGKLFLLSPQTSLCSPQCRLRGGATCGDLCRAQYVVFLSYSASAKIRIPRKTATFTSFLSLTFSGRDRKGGSLGWRYGLRVSQDR